MPAKIAFGAVAALAIITGIAIYTRSEPHGVLPRPPAGSAAAPHLENVAAQVGGSGSALEKPWLSREATEQIVGADGALGPVFAGVTLGGDPPSDAVRSRIADFARANDVAIDFEVAGGKLAAVRFAVAYGGCCGYEGADKLVRHFQRPQGYGGDGARPVFANEWALALPDGTHVRVDLHVAHVSARWERTITTKALIDRADALIGADPATVAAAAGDRWRTIEDGKRYMLEVPYPFARYSFYGPLDARADLGVIVSVEAGKIHEVNITVGDDDIQADLEHFARARWGAPRVRDDVPTWRTATRVATSQFRSFVIRAVP